MESSFGIRHSPNLRAIRGLKLGSRFDSCAPAHSTCRFSHLCRAPPGRLHSLAATLAALPSMSLVPVAAFSEPDLTIQRSNVLTISAAIRVRSCPFVVKRNQLDGELRRTDKRAVGKGIDP